jgi:hypothetical protein
MDTVRNSETSTMSSTFMQFHQFIFGKSKIRDSKKLQNVGNAVHIYTVS